MNFSIGETVICSIEVRNAAGNLVDPATSMKIQVNEAVSSVIVVASTSMTKDTTGCYHHDLQTSALQRRTYDIIYTATDTTRISIGKDTITLI